MSVVMPVKIGLQGLVLTLALLSTGPAGATEWAVVPDGSLLEFTGESQGERFDGRFTRFDARIRFDPTQLQHSEFDVQIVLASADTGNAERDETLLGGDFFAVEQFPQARYRANRFRQEDEVFIADGELTLRGITHSVPLRFTWSSADHAGVLSGTAQLDRLAFAVGAGDWADPDAIGTAVEVRTRLLLVPVAR